MLYSTAPFAPVVVAVSMVVPALQVIDPAEALTASGQPAKTCIEDVELLSAVLSPDKLPGVVQDIPLENNKLALTVEGPPILFPCTLIKIVRAVPTAITSLPLQTVIAEPVFTVIVQPVGKI